MRTNLMTLIVGVSLVAGAGCATKRGTGAATGAVAGGVVGGVVGGDAGLLIGAAVGGLLGYEAGRAMEIEDRRRIAYALERDEQVVWRNSQTGYQYQVEPIRERQYADRRCKEFRLFAEDERGREREVYGTACRQRDGSWELVDQRG
jgi:surface antigen